MWERLEDYVPYYYSFRLQVPGGWIIRSVVNGSVHQIFIGDLNHYWKLEKKEEKER